MGGILSRENARWFAKGFKEKGFRIQAGGFKFTESEFVSVIMILALMFYGT